MAASKHRSTETSSSGDGVWGASAAASKHQPTETSSGGGKSIETHERVVRMTRQLNIVPEKCTGCRQCELACSWVQTGTFRPARSLIRVSIFDEEASYAPYTCLQCDEAWCMTACPVNAITIDERTGAKLVIPSLCIDCHLCTLACPFGAVFTLPSSGQFSAGATEAGRAVKCDLCQGQPACVASCPTDAIEYAERDGVGQWFESWGAGVDAARLTAVSGTGKGGA